MDQLQVPFKFICQVLTMGTKYLSLENTHLLHLRQTQYVSRLGIPQEVFPTFDDVLYKYLTTGLQDMQEI